MENIKHIAFLVMPDVTLLDITGPLEVFTQACSYQQKISCTYKLHTISVQHSKYIRSASGLVLCCDENIPNIDYEIDTLFVPGIPNFLHNKYQGYLNKKTLQWINDQAAKARRICSVCTGTFFLAESGVLNGKSATTHWELCTQLQTEYSAIKVDNTPIFIKDGNVYTSAGISSGMDLALALVEEDCGRDIAMDVAQQMVLYLKRPGSQSQFSSVLVHQNTDYTPIRDIQSWIQENIKYNMSVETLAEKSKMSPRNFARVFVRETGITPAKYVDKLRIETASRFLTETQLNFKEIAFECGFGSIDNMRRQFFKYLQISPADYRRNFRSAYL